MTTALHLPVSAGILIPHAPPMRWVERLLAFHGNEGRVETCRLADNPLFSETQALPLFAMTELIAQAYAAVKGYQDLLAGLPVRKGFLVGVRKVELLERVSGRRPFQVRVRPAGMFSGFYMADGEVFLDDQCIARGSVKVWVPDAGGGTFRK